MSHFFVTPGNRKSPGNGKEVGDFEKKGRLDAWDPWKRRKVQKGRDEGQLPGLQGQETHRL